MALMQPQSSSEDQISPYLPGDAPLCREGCARPCCLGQCRRATAHALEGMPVGTGCITSAPTRWRDPKHCTRGSAVRIPRCVRRVSRKGARVGGSVQVMQALRVSWAYPLTNSFRDLETACCVSFSTCGMVCSHKSQVSAIHGDSADWIRKRVRRPAGGDSARPATRLKMMDCLENVPDLLAILLDLLPDSRRLYANRRFPPLVDARWVRIAWPRSSWARPPSAKPKLRRASAAPRPGASAHSPFSRACRRARQALRRHRPCPRL